MQKTAQSWFLGGPSSKDQPKSVSLLAEWNAYVAAQSADPGGLDLEAAAVHPTADRVSGMFGVFSKGVKDFPTSNALSGKSLLYFGILMAAGVFFLFVAFTMFLPVIMLVPQKFAICFTIGCALMVASLFAFNGPKNQLAHMSSKERLPFTLGLISSMVGTIYVSAVLHSYLLSVVFSVLQVISLSYYAMSYFPGGSSGLRFLSSTLASTVFRR